MVFNINESTFERIWTWRRGSRTWQWCWSQVQRLVYNLQSSTISKVPSLSPFIFIIMCKPIHNSIITESARRNQFARIIERKVTQFKQYDSVFGGVVRWNLFEIDLKRAPTWFKYPNHHDSRQVTPTVMIFPDCL